jgi:hypothetical protein
MLRLLAIVICVFGISPTLVFGDDKPKQGEPFEAPAPQALVYPATPQALPRPGTRQIWQYYGVDKRGRWVPRVILAPGGAYYYYNGAPFRYTTTQPNLFMPYILD